MRADPFFHSVTQIAGDNTGDSLDLLYRGEPDPANPPTGARPFFEGCVLGESFSDPIPSFNMDVVDSAWLQDTNFPARANIETPQDVLDYLYSDGLFNGTSNGTFAFDENDKIRDGHNGGKLNSNPFTGYASLHFNQYYTVGMNVIATFRLDIDTSGVITKSLPQ